MLVLDIYIPVNKLSKLVSLQWCSLRGVTFTEVPDLYRLGGLKYQSVPLGRSCSDSCMHDYIWLFMLLPALG